MSQAKSGPWVAGTVFGAIVILLAAWFLGISPTLASAQDTASQAQAQRDQNALLQVKIASLKKQFADLDKYKAELAGLQLQIPTGLKLADYKRQLNAIALAHSVTIVSIDVSPSLAVVPAVPAGSAPAPDPSATPDPAATTDPATSDGTSTDGTATGPTGPKPIPGFVQVPISLEIMATWANGVAFLQDLQAVTPRLFLVTGITGTSQAVAEAGAGRPATALGDLDLIVTGSAFVLTPSAPAVVPPTDPAAKPPVLPVPPGGNHPKNPLVPIG
jgi:hypothetical protein